MGEYVTLETKDTVCRAMIKTPYLDNEAIIKSIFDSIMSQVEDQKIKKVVVELDQVEYLMSRFLAILVGVYKELKSRGGELEIKLTRSNIKKVFEGTKLDTIFNISEVSLD